MAEMQITISLSGQRSLVWALRWFRLLTWIMPLAWRPVGIWWRIDREFPGIAVAFRLRCGVAWSMACRKGKVQRLTKETDNMTWPANDSNVVTTNLDAGADDPSVARANIKTAFDELKNVINGRAQASGVASLDSGTKVPIAQLPLTPAFNAFSVDSTPGSGRTFTVPAGVTVLKVTCVGGGGGGGYSGSGDHGGGGGAGGVITKLFAVAAGQTFSYTVGTKGTGHSSGSDGDGADGTHSLCVSNASSTPASFEIRANGGGAGQGPSNRYGGAGGSVSTTPADPAPTTTLGIQGGAGISGSTRGGAGGSNSFQGGVAGSSGYGGGGGFGSGSGTAGFDGTDGFVMFEW